jgi:hypothetical protein
MKILWSARQKKGKFFCLFNHSPPLPYFSFDSVMCHYVST